MVRHIYWTVVAHGEDTGYAKHPVGWFLSVASLGFLLVSVLSFVEASRVLFIHPGFFFVFYVLTFGALSLAAFVSLLWLYVSNHRALPGSAGDSQGYMSSSSVMWPTVGTVSLLLGLVLGGWFLLFWLRFYRKGVSFFAPSVDLEPDWTNASEVFQFLGLWQRLALTHLVLSFPLFGAALAHFYPERILHHVISRTDGEVDLANSLGPYPARLN
jgi:hypothetical protein